MQVDLQTAGVESIDAHGLYADFHALRHTFITHMMNPASTPKPLRRSPGTRRST